MGWGWQLGFFLLLTIYSADPLCCNFITRRKKYGDQHGIMNVGSRMSKSHRIKYWCLMYLMNGECANHCSYGIWWRGCSHSTTFSLVGEEQRWNTENENDLLHYFYWRNDKRITVAIWMDMVNRWCEIWTVDENAVEASDLRIYSRYYVYKYLSKKSCSWCSGFVLASDTHNSFTTNTSKSESNSASQGCQMPQFCTKREWSRTRQISCTHENHDLPITRNAVRSSIEHGFPTGLRFLVSMNIFLRITDSFISAVFVLGKTFCISPSQ